ncbi:hypothetical protein KC19_6G017800 [Ceratodon purpureus]|uniref:Uncharacterized protein n=1 Tax=Ceratodon purpureus TaxID=3225 RepID=A0A8T0HH33_CERPU|nr:hypothetical protein KC19_6G017800 [Ceratodon purpureus]
MAAFEVVIQVCEHDMLKLNLLAFSAEDPTQGSIGHGCWRLLQGEIRRVPHLPDHCKCSCVRLFMLFCHRLECQSLLH